MRKIFIPRDIIVLAFSAGNPDSPLFNPIDLLSDHLILDTAESAELIALMGTGYTFPKPETT